MKKINLIGLAVVVISSLVFLGSAYADTLIVPTQYPTIQAAINAANPGDTVLVQPGTYAENINFNGKEILVGSLFVTTGNLLYIDSTIIDGDQNGSVVTFNHSEGPEAILKGFTITNGHTINGGGIHCSNSSPTLENVTISGNTVSTHGGGIYCNGSSPTIKNVTISGNTANYQGGGIFCGYSSSPTLENVTISGNTSSMHGGGGISCYYSSPTLENVTISGNGANFGGGIYCYYSSPTLENVTISDNTTSTNGGGGGVCYYYSSTSTLENVTISGNTAGWGGGFYCDSASPILENVTISGNTASMFGGGIEFCESSSTLRNVTISGNTSSMDGGGIFCLSSNPTLENVTISGNTAADNGGGIGCSVNASPTLRNVTISGNTSDNGGGIYCEFSSDPTLENSILWDNSPYQVITTGGSTLMATYSNVEGGWAGVGNRNEDPLFVDPENGNYHLQLGSSCIDAGDPNPIYNDHENPNSLGYALYPALGTIRNDMGIYGGPNAAVGAFIAITSPQTGEVIDLSTEQVITWNTSEAITPEASLRLVITDLRKMTTVLDVLVPNIGNYPLPIANLLPATTYELELSYGTTEPPVSDIVKFTTE